MAYNFPRNPPPEQNPQGQNPAGDEPPVWNALKGIWETTKNVADFAVTPLRGLREGLPFGKNRTLEEIAWDKERKRRGYRPRRYRSRNNPLNWLQRQFLGRRY